MPPRAAAPAPFAIALFYHPTAAGAIAAGVELPRTGFTLPISRADAVAAGVLIPIAGHDTEPANAPAKPGSIPLPGYLYPSTSAIASKNFNQAEAFVRFQGYAPSMGPLPKPSTRDKLSSGILYPAAFGQAGTLEELLTVNVWSVAGLEKVLKHREGPLCVKIHAIESLGAAPRLYRKVAKMLKIGWTCKPEARILFSLATISEKLEEVEKVLLPEVGADPTNCKTARTLTRRLRVVKENVRRTKKSLSADIIDPLLCNKLSRIIKRLPKKAETYLRERLPSLVQTLQEQQDRAITFAC